MGLELVEIALETEEHFGIKIPDARLQEIRTYGELLDEVSFCVRTQSPTNENIDGYLRHLLTSDYWVKPEEIHREADLYRDLALG